MATKQTTAAPEPERWGPMDVGTYLSLRYSSARDLILSGKLGPIKKEGRHRTVLAERVKAYRAARDAKASS